MEWKDLPDTSTPITADNLNELKSSIITASPANNLTLTSNAYTTIPLDDVLIIGKDFEVVNNGIKCLKNGTVLISGKISFNSNSNGLKWLTIFRDTSPASANPVYGNGRITINCPPHLVGATAGQVFTLQVQGASGDVIRSSKAYTNITVEYK